MAWLRTDGFLFWFLISIVALAEKSGFVCLLLNDQNLNICGVFLACVLSAPAGVPWHGGIMTVEIMEFLVTLKTLNFCFIPAGLNLLGNDCL